MMAEEGSLHWNAVIPRCVLGRLNGTAIDQNPIELSLPLIAWLRQPLSASFDVRLIQQSDQWLIQGYAKMLLHLLKDLLFDWSEHSKISA